MTHRRRMIDTLLGRSVDRVPFGVGFGPWGQTLQQWREESGISDLDPATYFGYDPDFLPVPVTPEYGPFPRFEERVLKEDAEFVVFTDSRGITMRNRRDGLSMPEFIRHPIQTPADWERYKAERLQPRLAERLHNLDESLQAAQSSQAGIQVGRYPWGVFGTARDLMGAEELLISFYTQPELVHDIMKTNVDLWLAIYEKIAEKVQIDHVHIWEDMSGKQGSLISMAMVEEFMMPHYDRIADFVRRHNIPLFSVDTDGNCDELIPVFMRHGVNVMFPFEVQAGSDIERYRDLYPTLGMLGGLDKNALAKTKKEMNRELARAERMLAKGRYVPGCDHLIPPNVPWTNWKYFMEALKKIIMGDQS